MPYSLIRIVYFLYPWISGKYFTHWSLLYGSFFTGIIEVNIVQCPSTDLKLPCFYEDLLALMVSKTNVPLLTTKDSLVKECQILFHIKQYGFQHEHRISLLSLNYQSNEYPTNSLIICGFNKNDFHKIKTKYFVKDYSFHCLLKVLCNIFPHLFKNVHFFNLWIIFLKIITINYLKDQTII